MLNEIQQHIFNKKELVLLDCSNEIFTYDFISELIGMDLEKYISLNFPYDLDVDGYAESNKYIIRNNNIDVDIQNLCNNSNFPLSFFLKYPQLPRYNIEENQSITLDDILNSDIEWDYEKLQNHNPNITWEFISKHPYFDWNFSLIPSCPDITWDILMDIISDNPTNKHLLNIPDFNNNKTREIPDEEEIYNPKIKNKKDIINSIIKQIKRGLKYFSKNKNITWEIVEQNQHIHWIYSYIFSNKNISLSQLKQIYLKYKKPFNKLHKTEQFYFCGTGRDERIINKLEVNVEYDMFYNPNITEEFLEWCKQEQIKINYEVLSQNPAISLDYVMRNPARGWNYHQIHKRPNLTAKDIEKYADQLDWNYDYLMYNKFTYVSFLYSMKITEYINSSGFIIQDLKSVICSYV